MTNNKRRTAANHIIFRNGDAGPRSSLPPPSGATDTSAPDEALSNTLCEATLLGPGDHGVSIPGEVEGKVIGTAQSQYKANQGSLAAIELRNHVVTLIS